MLWSCQGTSLVPVPLAPYVLATCLEYLVTLETWRKQWNDRKCIRSLCSHQILFCARRPRSIPVSRPYKTLTDWPSIMAGSCALRRLKKCERQKITERYNAITQHKVYYSYSYIKCLYVEKLKLHESNAKRIGILHTEHTWQNIEKEWHFKQTFMRYTGMFTSIYLGSIINSHNSFNERKPVLCYIRLF